MTGRVGSAEPTFPTLVVVSPVPSLSNNSEEPPANREVGQNEWEAARHELRKARIVAWQAEDRLLSRTLAAIRRARQAHTHEYEKRRRMGYEVERDPLGPGGYLAVLGQIDNARKAIERRVEEPQRLLTAPCHDPLLLLTAPYPNLLVSESRVKKQARDRRYLADKRDSARQPPSKTARQRQIHGHVSQGAGRRRR